METRTRPGGDDSNNVPRCTYDAHLTHVKIGSRDLRVVRFATRVDSTSGGRHGGLVSRARARRQATAMLHAVEAPLQSTRVAEGV